jgi:hypothetical protein
LKPAIAVAVFWEIPGITLNSERGAVKISDIEPNLSISARKVILPTPEMDFSAIQYFRIL